MINAYFNQSLQWKKRTGINEFNEPIYELQNYAFISPGQVVGFIDTPVYEFPCRVEFVRKMVRGNGEQKLISNVKIYTVAAIQADDIVVYDGVEHLVLTTSPQFGLGGEIMWYEGAL
jgi:hypothetical protein